MRPLSGFRSFGRLYRTTIKPPSANFTSEQPGGLGRSNFSGSSLMALQGSTERGCFGCRDPLSNGKANIPKTRRKPMGQHLIAPPSGTEAKEKVYSQKHI
jgi:hypothetical protein